MLIVPAGTGKAVAGNRPLCRHAQQEMKAFVPPNAVIPLRLGGGQLTGQNGPGVVFDSQFASISDGF